MAAADYREIATMLRQEIVGDVYPPGSRFLTGPEVAGRFKVSRATANLAIGELRREGKVRTKRGRGTIVNPVPVLTREVAGRQRRAFREADGARGAFDAELRAAGLEPRTKVSPGRAVPPAAVAAALGIPEGEEAVFRRRVMFAGEYPVQIATSWLLIAHAGGTAIEEIDTGPGGIYSRLADTGHGPVSFTEKVEDRIPDDSEADALELDPDHHVWAITRTATDAQGVVVEVNLMTLPAYQWRLVFRWAAED